MNRHLLGILSAAVLALWLSPLAAQTPARDSTVRPDPLDTRYTSGDDQEIEPAVRQMLPQAERFRGALPAAVDLSSRLPFPGSQGKLLSCTAWAVGYAARAYYTAALDGRDIRQPQNLVSPSYVYHLARGPECKGTNFVRVVNVLKEGAPSLADYPYSDQCTPPPDPHGTPNATGFRVRGYSRIEPRQTEAIKGQLAQANPVLISFADSPEFHRHRGAGVFTDLTVDPAKDGWHAMTLVGYDDARQAFRLINSWGRGWGDGGYAWVGYDVIQQRVREAGVLDVPRSPPPIAAVPSTPAPAPVAQSQPPPPQPGSDADRALERYNRGMALRDKRDFDGAIAEFSAAIVIDPHLARAFNYRGLSYQAKGNTERAFADFTEAIRLEPRYAAPYLNRANVWAAKPDLDQAMVDYDQAIRLDPRFAAAYAGRGAVWRRRANFDQAIADYSEAIRLEPQNADHYNARGNVLLDKKDYDKAIDDYAQATRLNPKYPAPYNNRGLAWVNKKDYDRAIAEYDEAIRLNPNYALAFRNRGVAYRAKGNLDQAITDTTEAIRIEPRNADGHFQRAYTLRQQGKLDAALADYDETVRLNPRNAVAYNNRASIWRTKREFDRAIDDYSQCLLVDPAYVAALTGRGLAHEAKGEIARARQNFRAALSLPPKYDNGQWAHDTARARLAVLEQPGPSGAPAASVSPPPVTPPTPPTAVTPPPAAGGTRLALVIGNGAYRAASTLPNPPNDARAVAKSLRDLGFGVIEAIDLDRVKMEATVLDFLRRASNARTALFFYAGHAVQIDGRNYLVPIDATEVRKETAGFELLDVDRMLAGLDDDARTNVIILDACRDNPLETRTAGRSGSRGGGLAGYSTVGSGMLIAFATAPGKTALDGTGQHSPFTQALLKHMGTPNIEINDMLTRVRVDVVSATERRQIPWVNSSLLGELYLNDRRR